MNEYKFIVERTFTGTVKDTYTLVADNKEEAISLFEDIYTSPADMAMLTHESKIDNDEIVYNDGATVSISYKDGDLPFDDNVEILWVNN